MITACTYGCVAQYQRRIRICICRRKSAPSSRNRQRGPQKSLQESLLWDWVALAGGQWRRLLQSRRTPAPGTPVLLTTEVYQRYSCWGRIPESCGHLGFKVKASRYCTPAGSTRGSVASHLAGVDPFGVRGSSFFMHRSPFQDSSRIPALSDASATAW